MKEQSLDCDQLEKISKSVKNIVSCHPHMSLNYRLVELIVSFLGKKNLQGCQHLYIANTFEE